MRYPHRPTNRKTYSALSLIVMLLAFTLPVVAQTIPIKPAPIALVKPAGIPDDTYFSSIIQDKTGNLWMGTSGAGIYRFDGRSFKQYTEAHGLANRVIYCLTEAADGRIWVGTNEGAYYFDGRRFVHFTLPGLDELNYNLIDMAHVVRKWYRYKPVLSIVQDKTGNLWFGTAGLGLYRYDGAAFVNYRIVDGSWQSFLPDINNRINCNVYGNPVHSLLVDSRGDLWVGGGLKSGLFRYRNNAIEKVPLGVTLKGGIRQLVEDKSGRLWFSVDEQGLFSYKNGELRSFTDKTGLCHNNISYLLTDSKGTLWLAANQRNGQHQNKGCLSRFDGKGFNNFSLKNLPNTDIRSIFEDRRGSIWLGTTQLSLYRFDGNSITDYSARPQCKQ